MGPGERLARGAVIGFLVLAVATLIFGLGMFVQDWTSDDVVVQSGAPALAARADDGSISAQILDEIYTILIDDYVDKEILDPDTLLQAAIDGVIASLGDQHTAYLTQSEIAAGALDLSSSYEGIGATVSDTTGVVQIGVPYRDSPADKAGIRAGDIILEVDGVSVDGWSVNQAVQVIRGPKGTTVLIKVRHTDIGNGASGPEVETLEVLRGEIDIASVFTAPRLEVIPGESGDLLVDRDGNEATDIAYINIDQFHDNTLEELQVVLEEIAAGDFVGLIIDVRLNPGGLLEATVDVTNEFLDGGTILVETDSDGAERVLSASSGGLATEIPIVILMDGFSASGAEVLAAALKDNGRATLVGTRTFGKGTVNQLRPLTGCDDPAGCGALYVSVGRWLRPAGDPIEGLGVKPDIELELTNDIYETEGDIQVFAAIDVLRGN
jgi:carboxyl-terminal processing protease